MIHLGCHAIIQSEQNRATTFHLVASTKMVQHYANYLSTRVISQGTIDNIACVYYVEYCC